VMKRIEVYTGVGSGHAKAHGFKVVVFSVRATPSKLQKGRSCRLTRIQGRMREMWVIVRDTIRNGRAVEAEIARLTEYGGVS